MPLKDRASRLEYDRQRRNTPDARAAAKERTRLWRLANLERAKAACRKRYARNRTSAAAYSKEYHVVHKDALREYESRPATRARTAVTKRLWLHTHPWQAKMGYVRRLLRRAGCGEIEVQKALRAWETFDGVCQACGEVCTSGSGWVTDHDHKKLTFRGIIGTGCNTALGQTKDTPDRLRSLALYIERHHHEQS